MMTTTTRRHWLAATTGSACFVHCRPPPRRPPRLLQSESALPMARNFCRRLAKLFDQIGGLGRLVAGKTVTIKVNLTGAPTGRLGHLSAEMTYWTHPAVIGATVHLLGRAGARRIRVVECACSTAEPLAEFILRRRLGTERHSERGCQRGIVQHERPGNSKAIFARDDAQGRPHVQGLPAQSRLRGMRCLHVHREDEGASHHRHHVGYEELLRHHALHDLWRSRTDG